MAKLDKLTKKLADTMEKKAVDLEGKTVKTTEDELKEDKQVETMLEEKAKVTTSEDKEADIRVRVDLSGKEIDDMKPVKEEEKKDIKEDEEIKENAEESDKKDEEADETNEEAEEGSVEEDEKGDEEAEEEAKDDEAAEADEPKEESADEEVKEEAEIVEDEATDEVVEEETKEVGDLDVRLTKMEEKIETVLSLLQKNAEETETEVIEEAKEVVEAEAEETIEVEAPEAEVKEEDAKEEVVEDSEAGKSDSNSDISKIEKAKDDLIAKLEGEIKTLSKAVKPSKVLTPFAVVKGMEFFNQPTDKLTKVNDRLAEIDKIKKENPVGYEKDRSLQEEAFRLIKTKKSINYQLS